MFLPSRRSSLSCLLVLLFITPPAAAQPSDPKAAFIESVRRFSVAPDRVSLEAMTRALEQWDASLRSSESVFAENLPGSAPAAAARMHVAIGAAFLDRGRVQDALREFSAGAALDPARADVFTFEGVAYDQFLHDADRAAAAYARAAALDPLNPTRPYLLARALEKAGKRDEALAAYQAVLRLWQRDVSGRRSVAIDTPFIQLGLVPERPGAEPFFPPAQYADGFALIQRGEYSAAVEAFTRASAAAEPSHSDAPQGRVHYERGRELQRQNQTLEALAEYEAAVAVNPLVGANRLLQTIGALQAAQQNFAAALRAYSTRVDVTLNDPESHRSLGYLYARLDRRDEAFSEFAVALVIAPEGPNAADLHVAMSQLHLKNGDFAAAADAARRALALNPSSKQAHYSLATALTRLDRPADAKPEFEAFERLQSEDTAAAAQDMKINGLRRALEADPDNADLRRQLADAEALRRR